MEPDHHAPQHVPAAVFPDLFDDLNSAQAYGHACVVCRATLDPVQGEPDPPASEVVGKSATTGHDVRACRGRCASLLGVTGAAAACEQQALL